MRFVQGFTSTSNRLFYFSPKAFCELLLSNPRRNCLFVNVCFGNVLLLGRWGAGWAKNQPRHHDGNTLFRECAFVCTLRLQDLQCKCKYFSREIIGVSIHSCEFIVNAIHSFHARPRTNALDLLTFAMCK